MKTHILSVMALVTVVALLAFAAAPSRVAVVSAQTMAATSAAMSATGMATQEPLPPDIGNDMHDGLLRIVHAAPGAPAVDVQLDGQTVAAGLAFGNWLGYRVLPQGAHHLALLANGQTISATDVMITGHTATTAIAEGLMGAKDSRAFRLAFYSDDVSETNYRVRLVFIHAIPEDLAQSDNSNPVDVVQLTGTTGDTSNLLYKNLQYGQMTPGFVFDKGTFRYGFKDRSGQKNTILDFTASFDINTVYTAIAIGSVGNPKTDLKVIVLSVPGIASYQPPMVGTLAANPMLGATSPATSVTLAATPAR
jgi:hypothetical protein